MPSFAAFKAPFRRSAPPLSATRVSSDVPPVLDLNFDFGSDHVSQQEPSQDVSAVDVLPSPASGYLAHSESSPLSPSSPRNQSFNCDEQERNDNDMNCSSLTTMPPSDILSQDSNDLLALVQQAADTATQIDLTSESSTKIPTSNHQLPSVPQQMFSTSFSTTKALKIPNQHGRYVSEVLSSGDEDDEDCYGSPSDQGSPEKYAIRRIPPPKYSEDDGSSFKESARTTPPQYVNKKLSLSSIKKAWASKPTPDIKNAADNRKSNVVEDEDCYGDQSDDEDEFENSDTEDSFGNNVSSVQSRQKAVEALRAFTLAHIPTSSPPPFSMNDFPRSAKPLDWNSMSGARRGGSPSDRDRTLLIALHRCNLLSRLRNITYAEELELCGFGSKVGKFDKANTTDKAPPSKDEVESVMESAIDLVNVPIAGVNTGSKLAITRWASRPPFPVRYVSWAPSDHVDFDQISTPSRTAKSSLSNVMSQDQQPLSSNSSPSVSSLASSTASWLKKSTNLVSRSKSQQQLITMWPPSNGNTNTRSTISSSTSLSCVSTAVSDCNTDDEINLSPVPMRFRSLPVIASNFSPTLRARLSEIKKLNISPHEPCDYNIDSNITSSGKQSPKSSVEVGVRVNSDNESEGELAEEEYDDDCDNDDDSSMPPGFIKKIDADMLLSSFSAPTQILTSMEKDKVRYSSDSGYENDAQRQNDFLYNGDNEDDYHDDDTPLGTVIQSKNRISQGGLATPVSPTFDQLRVVQLEKEIEHLRRIKAESEERERIRVYEERMRSQARELREKRVTSEMEGAKRAMERKKWELERRIAGAKESHVLRVAAEAEAVKTKHRYSADVEADRRRSMILMSSTKNSSTTATASNAATTASKSTVTPENNRQSMSFYRTGGTTTKTPQLMKPNPEEYRKNRINIMQQHHQLQQQQRHIRNDSSNRSSLDQQKPHMTRASTECTNLSTYSRLPLRASQTMPNIIDMERMNSGKGKNVNSMSINSGRMNSYSTCSRTPLKTSTMQNVTETQMEDSRRRSISVNAGRMESYNSLVGKKPISPQPRSMSMQLDPSGMTMDNKGWISPPLTPIKNRQYDNNDTSMYLHSPRTSMEATTRVKRGSAQFLGQQWSNQNSENFSSSPYYLTTSGPMSPISPPVASF